MVGAGCIDQFDRCGANVADALVRWSVKSVAWSDGAAGAVCGVEAGYGIRVASGVCGDTVSPGSEQAIAATSMVMGIMGFNFLSRPRV